MSFLPAVLLSVPFIGAELPPLDTPGDAAASENHPPARPPAAAVLELATAAPGTGPSDRVASWYAALLAAGFPPVAPADRVGLTGSLTPPDMDLDEGRAALLTARSLFKQLDMEGSRAAAERAAAILMESPRLAQNKLVLSNVHLLLAEIALGDGRESEAARHLEAAIRLEPDRVLHPGLHPPPVLQAYRARRAALGLDPAAPVDSATPIPQGTLSVVVEPADAQLLLDGEPLSLDASGTAHVAAGEHYVIAVRQDGCSRARQVTVPANGLVALHFFVPPSGGARARAALRHLPAEEAVQHALEVLPATVVVALAPDGRATVATRLSHTSVVTVDPAEPTVQATQALRLLEGAPARPEVARPDVVKPVAEEGGRGGPPFLPILIGGAAAAVVVTVVAALGVGAAGTLTIPGTVTAVILASIIYSYIQPPQKQRGRVVLSG